MVTKRQQLKAKILALRARGHSYQQAANELDLDKSYVWRIANDKYKPHPRSKLAEVPKLNLEQLRNNQSSLIRGEIAEQLVITKLMGLGFDVWQPIFTRHRSDVGILEGATLVRIQVKLAGYDEKSNRFRCTLATKQRDKFVGYSDAEIDFFIIKCDGLDEYYVLPANIGNQIGYVNLYPHREKLTLKGIDYEVYRNQFELLSGVIEDE